MHDQPQHTIPLSGILAKQLAGPFISDILGIAVPWRLHPMDVAELVKERHGNHRVSYKAERQ
jgi:hypothetical protein